MWRRRPCRAWSIACASVGEDTGDPFTHPVKEYVDRKDAYLKSQLGNHEGADRPNKKHLDPRAWLSLAEEGMTARLVQACEDLVSLGKFFY